MTVSLVKKIWSLRQKATEAVVVFLVAAAITVVVRDIYLKWSFINHCVATGGDRIDCQEFYERKHQH